MRRRLTPVALALCALTPLVAAPAAPAAKRKKASKSPTITRVSPMRVRVGGTLTIRGKNFSRKRTRNTVLFYGPGGRSAFAKPRRASSTKLVVTVPNAVERLLKGTASSRVATRFKLRVLAGKFSRYTSSRLSPVVVSRFSTGGVSGGPPGGGGPFVAGCGSGADPDGDQLDTSLELTLRTDPCLRDTDLDGVEDGYEYKSAIDLNNDDYQDPNQSLPYPGKRPYANPLDPSDAGTDYDGDSLSLAVEQSLWKYTGAATLHPLSYSDGLQHSVNQPAAGYSKQTEFVNWASANGYRSNLAVPGPNSPVDLFDTNRDGSESASELGYNDLDGSTFLADEERDEDADGLTNFDEDLGRVRAEWWKGCYGGETAYYITYADTSPFDGDSDGDGVRDGADDQDHDDVPNIQELSRIDSSGIDDREAGQNCKLSEFVEDLYSGVDPPIYHHETAYGRVNPFNPCLPVTSARTCNRHPSFENPWAPFDQSPNWYSLN